MEAQHCPFRVWLDYRAAAGPGSRGSAGRGRPAPPATESLSVGKPRAPTRVPKLQEARGAGGRPNPRGWARCPPGPPARILCTVQTGSREHLGPGSHSRASPQPPLRICSPAPPARWWPRRPSCRELPTPQLDSSPGSPRPRGFGRWFALITRDWPGSQPLVLQGPLLPPGYPARTRVPHARRLRTKLVLILENSPSSGCSHSAGDAGLPEGPPPRPHPRSRGHAGACAHPSCRTLPALPVLTAFLQTPLPGALGGPFRAPAMNQALWGAVGLAAVRRDPPVPVDPDGWEVGWAPGTAWTQVLKVSAKPMGTAVRTSRGRGGGEHLSAGRPCGLVTPGLGRPALLLRDWGLHPSCLWGPCQTQPGGPVAAAPTRAGGAQAQREPGPRGPEGQAGRSGTVRLVLHRGRRREGTEGTERPRNQWHRGRARCDPGAASCHGI